MTLSELSAAYAESAELIRGRLAELRTELRETNDEEKMAALKRRIAELKPLYTEQRKLEKLCAHYYERGFWRDAWYTQNK